MTVKFLPAAKERLLQVWEYTWKRWGEEQADAYVLELTKVMLELPRLRSQWRRHRSPSLRLVRFLRHRHHYIFFRELEPGVLGVITVLHESMNLPRRFREDADPE